jgi:hypothetical protein
MLGDGTPDPALPERVREIYDVAPILRYRP